MMARNVGAGAAEGVYYKYEGPSAETPRPSKIRLQFAARPEEPMIPQHLVPPTRDNHNRRQITVVMCSPWLKAREKKTWESHTQRTRPVTVKAPAHRQQIRYSKGSGCRTAEALWRGLCYEV